MKEKPTRLELKFTITFFFTSNHRRQVFTALPYVALLQFQVELVTTEQ